MRAFFFLQSRAGRGLRADRTVDPAAAEQSFLQSYGILFRRIHDALPGWWVRV